MFMKSCTARQLLWSSCGLEFLNALDNLSCYRLTIFSCKCSLTLIKVPLSTTGEGYFHNTVGQIIAQVFFNNKVNYLLYRITLFLGTFRRYPLIKLEQKLQPLGLGFE